MNPESISYTFIRRPSGTHIDAIYTLLKSTYWANKRTRAEVEASLDHSIAIMALDASGKVVGCARAVTDRVTFAWICDVVVDEKLRGRGVGKQLVGKLIDHPHVTNTRKILVTKDAQGLYRQFGFKTHPFECMVKLPDKDRQDVIEVPDEPRR